MIEPTIQLQRLPLLAGDVFEPDVDLTEYVLAHSPSCYFIRVKGEVMQSLNIHDGDLLVVDRNSPVKANDLVIAVENDEFRMMQAAAYDARQYSFDRELTQSPTKDSVQLWGVVTHIIHHCR